MKNSNVQTKSKRYAQQKECVECICGDSCSERVSCSKYNITRIDFEAGYLAAVRDHIRAFKPNKK